MCEEIGKRLKDVITQYLKIFLLSYLNIVLEANQGQDQEFKNYGILKGKY